jgi:hypothetical protein
MVQLSNMGWACNSSNHSSGHNQSGRHGCGYSPSHFNILKTLHCKKRLAVFPSLAGMSLTKLSLAGTNLIIPGQGEFGISDIPAGDGKTCNLFYSAVYPLEAKNPYLQKTYITKKPHYPQGGIQHVSH